MMGRFLPLAVCSGNLASWKNGFEPIHQFVEQAAVVGVVVAVISPQAVPFAFSVPVSVVFSPGFFGCSGAPSSFFSVLFLLLSS